MKYEEIQELIADPSPERRNVPLAAYLYRLKTKHLDAITVYHYDDPKNPTRDLCNKIVAALELETPPRILVVEDEKWAEFLSLPINQDSSNNHGMYHPRLNCIYLRRSLFEGFERAESFGTYVMAHEHGHAAEKPAKKKAMAALSSRREFLGKLAVGVPVALAITSLSALASGISLSQDEEKKWHRAILGFVAGVTLPTTYAAYKHLRRAAELQNTRLEALKLYIPTAKENEFFADAQAAKIMEPDEIAKAMIGYTESRLLAVGIKPKEIDYIEDQLKEEINTQCPKVSADEKTFYLAVALADFSSGTLVRKELPRRKWITRAELEREALKGTRREYPIVSDRLINLEDIGVFKGYDTGFRLE